MFINDEPIMKKTFYMNDNLRLLLSNLIYDVQNYNSVISKYIDLERCPNNYCNESRNTIVRQTFLISRTMEALNDFNEISSNSFKLNMNLENIKNIFNEVLDDTIDLFKSKRVKFTLENSIVNECTIMMDRNRIKSSLLNIFSFIYNIVKFNGKVDINYDLIEYDDDQYFLLINRVGFLSRYKEKKLELNKRCIDISITFDSEGIPQNIKKKLFKTPLISYDNMNFNNLYLYTAYNIIKKHYGNMWIESLKNKERINIIFPAKNKL